MRKKEKIKELLHRLKWGHNYPVCGWFWCGYPLTEAEQQMKYCPMCRRKNHYKEKLKKGQ